MPQVETDAPYTAAELRPIREILQRRRHALIATQASQDNEIRDEQERGPAAEEEEVAAHEATQFVSTRMREGIDREVEQIDRALARMDAGNYGRCEECDEPIAIERLKVLPFTRLCAADAAMNERDHTLHSPGRSLTL